MNIPKRVDQLRVAGILDELSEKFFPFECQFVNLDAGNWEEQIERLNPHILFVESVWNGYKKTWRGKFTPFVSPELIELVNECKTREIPTVFWNKEDPIHLFTFLSVAFQFDHVFTTDMDCVPLYKRLLGHNRVGVLPFATSIQLFHPIETYERKDAACFAGSYYAKREQRRRDFENIADILIDNYTLDIYDRNPYPGNSDYTFPDRYQASIKGTLPVDRIDIAYKSYKLGITLNIVNHSSTMEARRIFELLSCNTLTLSNPCLGIKNLFGDLVIYNDEPQRFIQQIKTTLEDKSYYDKLRLLGLRKIIQEHTYKERLEYLYAKIFGIQPEITSPKIAVFSIVKTTHELNFIQASYDRQNYSPKQLFLFADPELISTLKRKSNITSLDNYSRVLKGDFDYYAYFAPENYYGKNYLLDLALSTRYATVSALGKSAYYSGEDGASKYHEELGAYHLIDRLRVDRSMFASHLLPSIDVGKISSDFCLEHIPCLSIDPYNFCENYTGESCPPVDDMSVNEGISMAQLYKVSDALIPAYDNYTLGTVLTGKSLYQAIQRDNKYLRFELLPLGNFGFYSLRNGTHKAYVENQIRLEGIKWLDELTRKEILYVFINGYTDGQTSFHIHYYSDTDSFLGSYLVKNQACTSLPIPNQAHYCKLSITMHGVTHGLVKEVMFGPHLDGQVEITNQENS